jgi:ribosome-associated translation inhibitor RaiA
MQIRVRTLRLDVPETTRHRIERRLRLVLGRHAAAVQAVRVTLAAGPEGRGALCRVRVALHRGGSVDVEDRGDDVRTASAQAFWRLSHRLARRRQALPAGAIVPRRRRPGLAQEIPT